MGARSGSGGGLGRSFYSKLAERVGTKGEFIVGSPSGERYDYTNFKLYVSGEKGDATLNFSSANSANKVLKNLQKKGWETVKGYPIYKYGDANDNRKYLNSKKNIF